MQPEQKQIIQTSSELTQEQILRERARRELKQERKSARQLRAYKRACSTLTIITYIWGSIVLAFFIQLIPSYLLSTGLEPSIWQSLLDWFRHSQGFPWDISKWLLILSLLILISITLLAFLARQRYKNTHPEGIDRLIAVLEQDQISPQLKKLQGELSVVITQLQHIHYLLQNSQTTAIMQELHTLSKKQIVYLESIQIGAHEQVVVQKQSQASQAIISSNLQMLSPLLKQIRDTLQFTARSSQPGREQAASATVASPPAQCNPTHTDPLLPASSDKPPTSNADAMRGE